VRSPLLPYRIARGDIAQVLRRRRVTSAARRRPVAARSWTISVSPRVLEALAAPPQSSVPNSSRSSTTFARLAQILRAPQGRGVGSVGDGNHGDEAVVANLNGTDDEPCASCRVSSAPSGRYARPPWRHRRPRRGRVGAASIGRRTAFLQNCVDFVAVLHAKRRRREKPDRRGCTCRA
jgi:hypothetical protein